MWFPDPSLLSSSDSSTAFVLLTWAEMFGDLTPDTYRPRLLDTYALVEEMSEVAQQAIIDARWLSHLRYVQEELKWLAASDPILLRHYPYVTDAITTLDGEIKASRLASIANVFKSSLGDYSDHVKDDFASAIHQMPKAKAQTLRASNAVGSLAIRLGLP